MVPPPAVVSRMRSEYSEMPGLRLTVAQACRLWQLDEASCRAALAALVADRVLEQTASGAYAALRQRPAAAWRGR